jgi:hypothetical protein
MARIMDYIRWVGVTGHVRRIVYTFVAACSRLFSTRRPPLSSSRLMGMYLSQANSKTIYTPKFQETRTRRNGKYGHVRTH